MLSDDVVGQVGKALGMSPDIINKGMAVAGPLTNAEWSNIHIAPLAATYLVAAASPSKGKGAAQELAAAAASVDDALKVASPTSLIGTAFGGGFTAAELDGLANAKPTTESVLKSIKEAQAVVAAKSPGDAGAYTELIVQVANNVASAAKEGGFLGIGGHQVSSEEKAALSSIKSALGL
jgi:hypothetical protein